MDVSVTLRQPVRPDARAVRVVESEPSFEEQETSTQILETGLKVIDLITPFTKGGKIGAYGGAGVGKTVIIMELIRNIATMHGSDIDELGKIAYSDAGARASGNGNITLTCMFNRILAVQTGVCMTGKGFRILLDQVSGSGGEGKLYLKRSVTYFEVPLLLRTIFLNKKGYYSGFAYHLFAGGAINMVVSAKEKLYAKYVYRDPYTGKITGRETDEIDESDLMQDETIVDTLGNRFKYTFGDFYRRNDLVLILGMTFEQRFHGAGIFLELQYNQGLLNFNNLSDYAKRIIVEYNEPDPSSDVTVVQYEAMFRTFSINFGVTIYIRENIQKSSSRYSTGGNPRKR